MQTDFWRDLLRKTSVYLHLQAKLKQEGICVTTRNKQVKMNLKLAEDCMERDHCNGGRTPVAQCLLR